jgi:membrane fusion protein (multidrug efflux system)
MVNNGPNPETDESPTKPVRKRNRRWLVIVVFIVVLAVASPYLYRWWRLTQTSQATDNATIQGRVVSVSSKISGQIESVEVVDFQEVTAGDVLIRLYQSDVLLAQAQAHAALELAISQADAARVGVDQSATQAGAQGTQAQGGYSLATTSVDVARAAVEAAEVTVRNEETNLEEAQARFNLSEQDYQRNLRLFDEGAIPQQQLDRSYSDYVVAQANLESSQNDIILAQARLQQAHLNVDIAEAQVLQSRGGLEGADAARVQTDLREKQYDAALAQVEVARINADAADARLAYTIITAPSDGRVGRITVQPGQRISPSQPLVPLVLPDLWVIANFKETQIRNIHPGLPAEIHVDAYPGQVFRGHVDSLSPASGATFALLPPENATGNFTKVVQRIPVRIVFEQGALSGYENLLDPGMSVIARVFTRPGNGD